MQKSHRDQVGILATVTDHQADTVVYRAYLKLPAAVLEAPDPGSPEFSEFIKVTLQPGLLTSSSSLGTIQDQIWEYCEQHHHQDQISIPSKVIET